MKGEDAIIPVLLSAVALGVMTLAYGATYGFHAIQERSFPVVLHTFFFGSIAYFAAFVTVRFSEGIDTLSTAAFNAGIQCTALALFFFFVGRTFLPWSWLAYGFIFLAAIQLGALAFQKLRQSAVTRLRQHYPDAGTDFVRPKPEWRFDAFQAQFEKHSYIWTAVPLGCVISFLWVALLDVKADEVPATVVACIFIVALLYLTFFLVRGAQALAQPLLYIDTDYEQSVTVPWSANLELDIRSAKPDAPLNAVVTDAVVVGAELRRLVLYNQHQMLCIGLAASFTVAHVLGWNAMRMGAFAAAALVFAGLSQLPFMIGQWRAHEAALERSSGVEREEMRRKLAELSPLAPASTTWLSFTGSGTLGGLAYGLIEKLLDQ